MGYIIKFRDKKGRITKAKALNFDKAFTKFGSNVIQDARRNLNKKWGGKKKYSKRTKSDTLYKGLHYNLDVYKNGLKLDIGFGKADKYWEFIDQGVRGQKGNRGMGSPFKFKIKQPPLSAILKWMSNKPIRVEKEKKKSIAFAIARSIKTKGIYRTRFISKPIEENYSLLPKKLTKGFRMDVGKLFAKALNTNIKMKIKL